jgi:hypothetical protein
VGEGDPRRSEFFCRGGGVILHHSLLDAIRARLTHQAPAQEPRERVTVVIDPDCDDVWGVRLDGKAQHVFAGRNHADRYAAGLRLELDKEAGK